MPMRGKVRCDGGSTRRVILIGSWAIKLPRFGYGWRNGLWGLLANMQEVAFAPLGPEFCPVVFSLPGGWLVVMRRARPLTPAEWAGFDYERFVERGDYLVPAENKDDSFGVLDGRLVAVDYGT